MMKYYICMGDRTTGGGVVVEGNVRTIIMGRPVASVGMRVMCCHGPQRIVQGWAGHLDHGSQIAYHGCLLSCGHQVISSQNLMGWSDGSSETTIPEQLTATAQKYHEFYTLLDDDHHPIANQKYRLSAGDGSVIEGYTNEQGQTEHLWTHEQLPVNMQIIDDEEESEFDQYHITDL